MSNLLTFAQDEMRRAGLYDADADYAGEIPKAVERMISTFAAEGHSGMSAELTLQIFEKVARFKPLTPITSDPSEWMDVSEYSGGPMWQNRRSPTVFSTDGGATWYDLDAPKPDDGAQ
jgi:hypothetical protein